MPSYAPINLSAPCSACGNPVGGGLHYCPRCKIALCYLCSTEILSLQIEEQLKEKNVEDLPPNSLIAKTRCPMCEKFFP